MEILPQIRPENAQLTADALLGRAQELARNSKSANTLRAYASDWRGFRDWCHARELASMPAEPRTVALYLADLAGSCKASTIQRKLTAIAERHRGYGEEPPTQHQAVRAVMSGIRRTLGTAPVVKKPLITEVLAGVLPLPDTDQHVRDRALLLLGFAGALRRSELVALDWEDVETTANGIRLRIRRSKTDQEAAGRVVGVPYIPKRLDHCAARALQHWQNVCGHATGPVFTRIAQRGKRLGDQFVARLVKRTVAAAGFDPREYSGHSLRAGFATSAAEGGAEERAIMQQTGHRSVATVRRYIREGSVFRDNALLKTGL